MEKNKAQQQHSAQMLTQKVHMIGKAPFYETDSYLFVYYNQIAASGSGNDKDSSAYCFLCWFCFFKFAKGSVFIAECRVTCKQVERALMTASPAFEW